LRKKKKSQSINGRSQTTKKGRRKKEVFTKVLENTGICGKGSETGCRKTSQFKIAADQSAGLGKGVVGGNQGGTTHEERNGNNGRSLENKRLKMQKKRKGNREMQGDKERFELGGVGDERQRGASKNDGTRNKKTSKPKEELGKLLGGHASCTGQVKKGVGTE